MEDGRQAMSHMVQSSVKGTVNELEMTMKKFFAVLTIAATAAAIIPATSAMARHGADDPAGDDRGGKGRGKDDGANHTMLNGADSDIVISARRGADDPAGDDRGGKGGGKGRGKDDGANHA